MMQTQRNAPRDAYAEAGVDISAADDFIERLKPLAKSTLIPGAIGGVGGFGAVFDPKAAGLKDPLLVMGCDSTGTKLLGGLAADRLEPLGQDAVAMSVNDVLTHGARPLAFLDYMAFGKLDPARAERLAAGVAEACRAVGCALIGGETAEMPGLYQGDEFELAGFALGAVEREHLLPRKDDIQPGDVVIGLASDGVHSNGFSLVRKILAAEGLGWNDAAPFDPEQSVADVFLTPTRLYVRPVLEMLAHAEGSGIRAMAHITGGGLTENLPRILPEGLGACLDGRSWTVPPEFIWMKQAGGVTPADMLRSFNCGIGFCLVVSPETADKLCTRLQESGERPCKIGHIMEGKGISWDFLPL